jgi:hypothetical protein
MTKIRLHRRSVLKGLFGTAVALPLLECMMDDKSAHAAGAPLRYFVSQGGFSLNKAQNGVPTTQGFEPNNLGAGYDVKAAVSPLNLKPDSNGNPVKDVISIVSGMDIPHASDLASQPPASRYIGDSFHFHTGPMLCGVKQIHELSSECIGESSDTVLSKALNHPTSFANLTTRVQAGFYNLGETSFHRDTMTFENINGSIIATQPQTSPTALYNSLFTNFVPDDPAAAAQKQAELDRRRSVLDLVDRQMNGLIPRLGAWDKQRLELHYEHIRELEILLQGSQVQPGGGACQLPTAPQADPAVGGDFAQPFSWNSSDGWSDEAARSDSFNKLIHMAFVCDLTRVWAHMYTMFQSFMNISQLIGASFNQHAMNHNGNQAQLDQVIAWHVEQFADLVAMLRDTPEGGGSVLDNCAMVFLPEGGYRDNPAYVPGGWSHNTENMCALLAGGAGGLKQGEHIRAPSTARHPVNLLISMMTAVGYQQNSLNEISGLMPDVFT